MHTLTPTNHVRLFLLRGLAAGLLFMQLGLSALAQTAATTPSDQDQPKKDETTSEKVVVMEEFKVTAGFAGSLAAAAEIKEAMPVITEVIAAEDIGKLPDISIADSLTRLTGLTTQRTNGRSQEISIRGLVGDFSTGMLNGREQVSTNLNRAVEYDQYPAELINEVVVYKTAAANLIGQGLAGTIDLRTVEPLSKSGRVFAVSGYYQWTQLGQLTPGAKKDGNRVSISYIDQLNGGTLGIAVGYAHTSTPWEGKQFQAWGYPTDSSGNFALGGTKSYVRTSNLDRDGLMGVIEYKPNKQFHSTLDIFSSRFEEKQLLRGMEIPLAFWSSAQLQPGYTVTNGLITNSVLRNVQPVMRNDIVTRKDNLFAAGWNLTFGDGSGWTTVFDAAYSRVTRTDRNLETYSGLGFNQGATNPDTMTEQLIPGQTPIITTTVDYTNTSLFKLTDPQGWGVGTLPTTGMQGYLKYFQSKDELGQLKLLTKHELKSFFDNVEIGASYSDRYKRDGEKPTGWIYNASGQPTAALPPIIGTTDMSFLGIGRIYAYDPLAAWNSGLYSFYPNPNNDVIANRWNVTEKTSRAYVQFDMDGKIGSMPVQGNVGVQFINTDQSSKGYSALGTPASLVLPVSGGDKYTDVAPSLNLTFKPAARTYVRFSLARQLARPRMFDMRAARNFNYNSSLANSTDPSLSPWSADGGNPQLKPWRSNSIDLSIEKYFKDNMGYISLAAFDKDLRNYIYQQTVLADFTGYPYTGTTPRLFQGPMTSPVNGQGGSIKGLEFTWSLPSELISKSVRGFGVVLGGAYTDSSIQPWGPTGGTSPIAGLSRKVANVTFYYERYGFSARISERYRSSTREYITNFGPPNFKGDVTNTGFSTAQPEKVVDAQVSYTLQAGPLKGLTFFLQAYNLNNEPLITYNNDDPRQVMNYQVYGSSYSAGASYKF
jgi:iron complex outermembrane receptor protein